MKTSNIILLVLLAIVLLHGCSTYNGFVGKDEQVKNAWGDVQSAYQRRADLVPNLVETVKGAANFEQKTLTDVIEARAKATSMTIDPSKATPEQLQAYMNAQGGLSQALGRLMVVSEQYPQLRATESFKELQSQLEGTENRIKVSRDKYNAAVTDYNVGVRRFPSNLYARMFGFNAKPQFEADPSAQKAPQVKF
ncbi:MAG: LemA family protein [Saprospiraceae bacterium]|nr:LemA family protein [Saprospiraceae bacterium]MBP7679435.1 LemA family protein [Saprospiraceae bacterium]